MECSAEYLFSQAWLLSVFAVTVSFGGETVDPRLLHSLSDMELATALSCIREA